MSSQTGDEVWRGTSDSPTTLAARCASTPEARLVWLEDSLVFAQRTGALGKERARRQRAADAWWRAYSH